MTLTVSGPVVSWLWSTGDTTSSIKRGSAGRVSCATIDTAGCRREAAFDVLVNPSPRPVIVPNRGTTICQDEQVVLTVDKSYVSYRWSTGETTKSITTSIEGEYVAEVVDVNGCIGRSEPVTVIVRNVRNQAKFLYASSKPEYVIADHEVGLLRCMNVGVVNLSDTSNLIMRGARFKGNVFFSVPQGQFPITIPPSGSGELVICASAVDVGPILDTLQFDDACSTVGIPVFTTGLPIAFQGTSRCDLPVETSIIRAGSAWRLRAPYPNPSDNVTAVSLARTGSGSAGVSIDIVDLTGTPVIGPTTVQVGHETTHNLDVAGLRAGLYVVRMTVDGELLTSFPLIISR